jgi:hypothetical protein
LIRTDCGSCDWKPGSAARTGVDDLDRVGARLAQHGQGDRALAVEGRRGLDRLEAVLDLRDVAQAHRIAVARADDQVRELGGVAQLLVRLQGQRLLRPFERADRRVGVRGAQRIGQFVEADVARRQRLRVDATRTA